MDKNMNTAKADLERVQNISVELARETGKIIIGKEQQIQYVIMSILCGGHILLDDLPGSGKTTLVKALSAAMGCDFKRIQFTPDLLPSDITGMNIYDRNSGEFRYLPGPVYTNLLLADEINRAIPRTQSALLEAMEERQVTVDGETRQLSHAFWVMATQNPVENESTFKLPTAQMDRFFICLSMGYPSPEEEVRILSNLGNGIGFDQVCKVTDPETLIELQKEIETVFVSEEVKNYIITLVHQTRNNSQLKQGASPRASRSLYQGGKAWAAMQGRDFVLPDDIKAIAVPVLAHRIMLNGEARFSGLDGKTVIQKILETTPVPPDKEAMLRG